MIHKFTKNKYTIRALTSPYQGMEHTVGKRTIGCFHTKQCPLCIAKYVRRAYWIIGLIDREDNTAKIFRMGTAVFRELADLAKDVEWGDPMKYDIELELTHHGYVAEPLPKTALSIDDIRMQMNIDKAALLKLVEPIPLDRMEKLMVLL